MIYRNGLYLSDRMFLFSYPGQFRWRKKVLIKLNIARLSDFKVLNHRCYHKYMYLYWRTKGIMKNDFARKYCSIFIAKLNYTVSKVIWIINETINKSMRIKRFSSFMTNTNFYSQMLSIFSKKNKESHFHTLRICA